MLEIFIQNQRFSYTVNRKPIHSLRLHLTTSHSFSLSCPVFTPNFVINRFLRQNSAWILKHSPKIIPRPRPSSLKSLTILGDSYQLIFNQTLNFKIDHIEHKIYSKNTSTLKIGLKKTAHSIISNQLSDFREQFPFSYHRLTLRNQKSRFGSCSSLGNLNFNWQIIFFPLPQFRHILLHEIAHLKIKNHSKDFYRLLSQYDPDYLTHRRWLKKEGSKYLVF